MSSVTRVVRSTKQPRGGYVNPRTMTEIDMKSGTSLNPSENISPALMGLIVDYMSRFMLTGDATDAFDISVRGARNVEAVYGGGHLMRACDLLTSVTGLNRVSISAAYQLVSYDIAFRVGPAQYIDSLDRDVDETTARNAITMVKRTLRFVDRFGPITAEGMTFLGGYTDKVSSGDADFCTRDILWDMKVSKKGPTKDHTLQLMMYLLMGRHAGCEWAEGIESIGVWNPRLDKAWTKRVDEIDGQVIEAIKHDIIGYSL